MGMTDEQKKVGKEILVMGYALSYKSWIMLDQKLLQITPDLTNYMMGLPKEIMVINKFYPQSIFGILGEEELFRDTYGYKFAIQHKGTRSLLIEPYIRTELLGFPEFYHKKRTKWYQRFWDMVNSWSSTDPFENYSYSSCILWEGDYVTAFGLVSYQASNDTFTMTKPIAIVKGGIDALKNYFAKRAAEKGAKSYIYLISAVFLTTATIACYYVGKHYYKRLEERAIERADKITELDNMT